MCIYRNAITCFGSTNNFNSIILTVKNRGPTRTSTVLSSLQQRQSLIPSFSRRELTTHRLDFTSNSKQGVKSNNQQEMVIFSSPNLQVHHLHYEVESTQDEIKQFLRKNSLAHNDDTAPSSVAVIADYQVKGRGTSGRAWVASKGNLYLTCALPSDIIPQSKVTLLPLATAILVAEIISQLSTLRPTVKWPNDVLIDRQKIAGTLIENYRFGKSEWWLVGIGINVESYPRDLSPEHGDALAKPRAATSLSKHASIDSLPAAADLGVKIATELMEWALSVKDATTQSTTEMWKSWATLGEEYIIRETGESVRTLDIHPNGQLEVIGEDGKKRLLLADYFH